MKYIEKEWDSFNITVVPKEASHGQVRDLRMAFFAGALAAFDTIVERPGKLEDYKERLTEIKAEILTYSEEVRKEAQASINNSKTFSVPGAQA